MKPSVIPANLTGKELFDFCVKNEQLIFHAKKSEIKKADGLYVPNYFVDDKGALVVKAANERPMIPDDANKLKVDVVINTSNYFDSHWDVHIPGLWNKSISDMRGKGFYLLEAHGRDFDDVIGEGLKASAKKIAWKDLGFDFTGITEALMFSGEIEKGRNEFMFDQYRKGYVKQHSVGMRYVKLVTCINDDDYPVQKENWDKYITQVVNRADAEESGIFWAVLEAKCIEGSAVLFGSNDITPTYNVEDASTGKEQPGNSTTHQPPKAFNVSEAIKTTQIIKI